MKNLKIIDIIKESLDIKSKILHDEQLINLIENAITMITKTFENGNKVFFCGNGGSAADAQHLAAEFSGRFYIDRKALPSEALHCNTSYLTAVANDYSYDLIYSRLLEGIAVSGDVLIGISTSGNSKNIINAFIKANELGIKVVSLTGNSGGQMKNFADISIRIPSDDTPRIQEAHILVGHIICQFVEENLFAKNDR